MKFNVGSFVGSIVGLSVGVILTASILPIISGINIPEGMANGDAIQAMFNVLPILFVVGLVMGGVYAFISRKG